MSKAGNQWRVESVFICYEGGMRFIFMAAASVALAGCVDQSALDAVEAQAEGLRRQVSEQTKEIASLKDQLDAAKSEQDALRLEIQELSQTPSALLAGVNEAVGMRDLARAQDALEVLRKKYPAAAESVSAGKAVESLAASVEREQREAERLAALGFKALAVGATVDAGPVKVTIGTPSVARTFVFDRYDDRYHYREADRGNQYVRVSMSATAAKGESDPDLPGVAVYRTEGDRLRRVSQFSIEFSRWQDYGTYLGNYSDYRNDFAKTATIQFSLGAEVPAEVLKQKPLYLVATRKGCHSRSEARFRNPPVYYSGSCEALQSTLSINDFAGAEAKVTVVRRMN